MAEEQTEERGRERHRNKQGGERVRKKRRRRGKTDERKSLCSGSGLTSFLAPQWETMKY